MIAVTGATGQLGRLVISHLQRLQPSLPLIAAVRDPAKAADLKADIRHADYDKPETLVEAFKGVDKLLLISANEIGRRFPQHKAAIDAARTAGVKLIVYTSLLRADTSPMTLTDEHKQTEAYLKASGIPHTLLRNGWYTENDTGSIAGALAHGAYIGSSADGRISWAARNDYAEAAARVILNKDDQAGKVYELAGDEGLTMADLAAETTRLSGKTVAYANLPEADFAGALRGFGLPEALANILADSSAKAANGALYDDTHTLSRLLGRPTTPISETIAQALKAQAAA